MLDRIIGGHGEERIAYDLTRAHSADVFFLKMRAWFWGITISVVSFFLGNLLGAFGTNILGDAWQGLLDTWEWI
tara:strand:+ start:361 stop:582 length:222 start_codon:yes stop_codon:yes gene_type:complete